MKISELNSLVEACAKANVEKFKLGDIEITFFKTSINNNEETYNFPLTETPKAPNISTGSVPFDTALQKYEQLEALRLSDPVAFEEMVETE